MKQSMEKEDSEPAEMEKRPIQETPEGRIQALENENGTLEKQNKVLKTRVLTLKNQVEALEEENINLISDKQTLESKIQALEKLLQQENKELKTRALTHKKQDADLVEKYKTLSSNQQNLDKEINDVSIKLEDLSTPENRRSSEQKLQEKGEAVYISGPQKPLDATAGHALMCNVDGKDKTEISKLDSQHDVRYTNEEKIREMVNNGQFSDLDIRSVNMAKRKKVITPHKDYLHRADEASVKMPAYKNILGLNEHDESGEKFAKDDERIFNIAKDNDKNSSVQFPARLNESFFSYVKSIGAVVCADIIIGTCFLVKDNWVLTNYHVYEEAKDVQEVARNADNNNRFPIVVMFDYFHHRQSEDVFIVEVVVDESISDYESVNLDYKFLRLQEHEKLRGRVGLGTLVRTYQLHLSIEEQIQQVQQEIRQQEQPLFQQGPGQQEQQGQQRLHQNLQNKLQRLQKQQQQQLEQQSIQERIQQQIFQLEQQQQQVHQEEQRLQEQQLQSELQQQQHQQQQLQQLRQEQLLQAERQLQQKQQEVERRKRQLNAQGLRLLREKQQNQLQQTTRDNRVILVGHPEGKEMQVEVCRIIGFSNIKTTVDTRGREIVSYHMTNEHLLDNYNNQGCLAYDATFYKGSSGSPAFYHENGKIVAMHTQAYRLWNEAEEKIYSLMEFGIPFATICRDMRENYGDNVVNYFFRYSELSGDEEPMDQSLSRILRKGKAEEINHHS